MNATKGLAAVVVVVVVGLAAPVTAAGGGHADEECLDRAPHAPIRVEQDHGPWGFTVTNPVTGEPVYRPGSGVVAGSGSEEDPYVIEGWCVMTAPTTPALVVGDRLPGIVIEGTQAHVVVRNNVVVGTYGAWTPGYSYGVYVDDAANVAVAENTVTEAHYGIRVRSSDGVVVRANTVTGNGADGVRGILAERLVVQDNVISRNGRSGIELFRSDSAVVQGNIVSANGTGVVLNWSGQGTVEANAVSGNDVGILLGQLAGIGLSPSNDNTIQDNTITGNTDGIVLENVDGTTIQRNTVSDNDGDGVHLRDVSSLNAVRDNDIHDNRGNGVSVLFGDGNRVNGNNIWGNGLDGLLASDVRNPLDATANWWGCADGPGNAACDTVEGDVVYAPWLTDRNPSAGAP